MEIINSFFSNIKDKLTNPFFGTLILVLLIHHWQFIYSIFNFDSDFTFTEKLSFLQNYISENITYKTLLIDLAYALGYMTLGFLIVIGTRSIVLLMEHNLMPLITKRIVSKNVVEKSLYDEVVKEREDYFDQYEEQRKNVRSFSKTIDAQNEQIKDKDKDLVKQSQTLSRTIKEKDRLDSKLSASEKEKAKLTEKQQFLNNSMNQLTDRNNSLELDLKMFEDLYFGLENEKFYTSKMDFPPEIRNRVEKLIQDDKWDQFIDVGNFFQSGGRLSADVFAEMVDRRLAYKRGTHEQFTPVGKIIWRYRKIFDDFKLPF